MLKIINPSSVSCLSYRSSKALGELMENGYIVLVIDGNTRRSPVYMINPEIATVGKRVLVFLESLVSVY